jgi:hypothetical protein
MSGEPNATRLTLLVNEGADVAPEDLDKLTRQLRREIEDLGVESVRLAADEPAPSGTKSMEAVTLGALAVAVLPTALPRLIEFLQAWSLRGKDRTVKIKATVGDRTVDVEYPAGESEAVVKDLIAKMTATIDPKSQS